MRALTQKADMNMGKEGVGRSGSGHCPAASSGFCNLLISGLLDGPSVFLSIPGATLEPSNAATAARARQTALAANCE